MIRWDSLEKKNHLVLVIPRKKLFGANNEHFFEGFSANESLLQPIFIQSGFLTRGQPSKTGVNDEGFAESDEHYKQIIPYAVIVNKKTKKVYTYRRASSTSAAFESRLHGKWSWGVGGHVDFQESFFTKGCEEFLQENLKREMDEEVRFINGQFLKGQLLGFINDDSDAVGRVHFGLVFVVETDATIITPKDSESVEGKFLSLQELEELSSNKEVQCDNWSRILVPHLKKKFS